MSDIKKGVLDDSEIVSKETAVEKLYEVFESIFDRFDGYLAKAIDTEMVEEFMQGYAALRESGFDFDDAVDTAAQELSLDEDEEEDDTKDE